MSDLDDCAPFTRFLDFLEEMFLASASVVGSEESVLAAARQLMGATGDILKILDTWRSLVADSDLTGRTQLFWARVKDKKAIFRNKRWQNRQKVSLCIAYGRKLKISRDCVIRFGFRERKTGYLGVPSSDCYPVL